MKNVNLVKIGSDSVNEQNLSKLMSDIKEYEGKNGESFVIISSGAVKLGKKELEKRGKGFSGFSKSSLSAIGQQFLMQTYDKLSGKDRLVWQCLQNNIQCIGNGMQCMGIYEVKYRLLNINLIYFIIHYNINILILEYTI